MYLSYEALNALHQDKVKEHLRRSELRRMVKASEGEVGDGTSARRPGMTLRSFVTATLGISTRP